MLLETVALGENQGSGTSETGNVAARGHPCGNKPQGAVAIGENAGNANGHDEPMA